MTIYDLTIYDLTIYDLRFIDDLVILLFLASFSVRKLYNHQIEK